MKVPFVACQETCPKRQFFSGRFCKKMGGDDFLKVISSDSLELYLQFSAFNCFFESGASLWFNDLVQTHSENNCNQFYAIQL